MINNRFTAVLLGTALLLGGCDFADQALLPSLSGSSAGTSFAPGPKLGTTSFTPQPPTPITTDIDHPPLSLHTRRGTGV